jgi:guanylate kinase
MSINASMNNKGNLYIISAPSGAGKTSLLKALTGKLESLDTSISTTTRKIRSNETDGVDYHFVSIKQFNQLVEQNEFIEHAEVFGNYYGTSKSKLSQSLATGNDLVVEIDWQGAQQVRQHLPDAISIFILPPSQEELAQRLNNRGLDNNEVIANRMAAAIEEISHYNEYDYLVINDVFDKALTELETIICANKLLLPLQKSKYQSLIDDLL